MNRRRGAPPPGGKLAAPGPTSKDKRLETVAAWLRNEKRSGLKVKEAVQYERRVDYFKGAKVVDALLSPKNKLKEAPVKSRAEELKALAAAKKVIAETTGGAASQTYGLAQALRGRGSATIVVVL